MSKLVRRGETVADPVRATNRLRDHIVSALARYFELSARMRDFENTFGRQVLQAAARLREIVASRHALQVDCARIRARLAGAGYASVEEVEADISSVLSEDRGVCTAAIGTVLDADPGPGDEGADLDPATKDRITREFKRIVLPAVHADTSGEPFPVFDAVYNAYRARDYVVMEALVIQYRGAPNADRLTEYRAAQRRLDARLRATGRHATDSELRDPADARRRMAARHQQIRRAIDEQAEHIEQLRRSLETLLGDIRGRTHVG